MAGHSRRAFLLKLARGAAYSAPMIRTLAAPDRVAAQASPSQKGEMKGKKFNSISNPFTPNFGPSAPWQKKP